MMACINNHKKTHKETFLFSFTQQNSFFIDEITCMISITKKTHTW